MFILRLITYIFGAFTIIALTIVPNIFPMEYHTDKMLHIFVFGITMALFTIKYYRKKQLKFLVAALFILGITIEIVQSFLPSRAAEWGDLASDVIGILLGLLIGYLLRSGYYAKTKT